MKSHSLIRYLKIFLLLLLLLTIILNFSYPLFYRNHVNLYSKIFDIDPYLVFSTIKAESNFDKNATSDKNAKGLMQILDETGEEIFEKLKVSREYRDLYNPEVNIMVGTYYLSALLDRYDGDVDKAIAAYNSGMANVDRWSKDKENFRDEIDFKETENYIKRVEKNYRIYKFFYDKLKLSWLAFPTFMVNIKLIFRKIVRGIKRLV